MIAKTRTSALRATALAAALATCVPALAAPAPQRADRQRPPRAEWHGDIHRFGDHDWHLWRGGRWVHGRHDGRIGWWWVVGTIWYFYPAPIYPYPNPYEPPPVALVSPPLVGAPPPPPAQHWYYCDSAQRYYPYVATCPEGWRAVPAVPADAPK
jgi:hypothetical protein